MDIRNYYLDLKAMGALTEYDKGRIHSYYEMMIQHNRENHQSGVTNRADGDATTSYFNTLLQSGYLKSVRDEKLEILLS